MPDSTPKELLARLDYSETAGFPKNALQEIVTRQDELAPHLIEVIHDAHVRPEHYLDGPEGMLHIYAVYLLAQFRDTRAYRPLLTLLSGHSDLVKELFGDTLTEDMHNIVACLFDGDEKPLRELIENPAAHEYARACAGLHTYLARLNAESISIEVVEDYFRELFEGKLERTPSHVWDSLCSLSADLGFESLWPHIQQAFGDKLCDPFFDTLDDMENRITSGGEWHRQESYRPIDDTIAEMQDWACFDTKSATNERSHPMDDLLYSLYSPEQSSSRATTPASPSVGVGRNEPCPCGSGLKFKKCCGG